MLLLDQLQRLRSPCRCAGRRDPGNCRPRRSAPPVLDFLREAALVVVLERRARASRALSSIASADLQDFLGRVLHAGDRGAELVRQRAAMRGRAVVAQRRELALAARDRVADSAQARARSCIGVRRRAGSRGACDRPRGFRRASLRRGKLFAARRRSPFSRARFIGAAINATLQRDVNRRVYHAGSRFTQNKL